MQKNAILFDAAQSDLYARGGIVFKVSATDYYVDAYNEIKPKLESPSIISHLVEDHCLVNDLFDDDKTYKFHHTCWSNSFLVFVFVNSEGMWKEFIMKAVFVYAA
jgi:hypothetical protein